MTNENTDGVLPYCPNCGAELETPAGPYTEWTDCPTCGTVHVEFYRPPEDDE